MRVQPLEACSTSRMLALWWPQVMFIILEEDNESTASGSLLNLQNAGTLVATGNVYNPRVHFSYFCYARHMILMIC